MGKGKYDRQVILTALKTAITDLLSNHPRTRKYTICCYYYSPILCGFNHRKRVSPELDLTLHYMGWKRKKVKTIFAKPANIMLLLQHSASGHAASAAPSALERLQGGKSSWECNKLRIQYNHDCSGLWVHLKPHLPSSCFLFSDTYFVKLVFLICPPLSRCLNYLFLTKGWFHMPFQCVTFSMNSQDTASWWNATYNGDIRHQE